MLLRRGISMSTGGGSGGGGGSSTYSANTSNLDGSTQYFSTSSTPFEFTSDFSFSLWAKAETQVDYGRVLDCSYFGGAAPTGRGGWFLGFDSTNLSYEFRLDDVGSGDGGCVSNTFSLGDWVHVVCTYNKSTETALIYTAGTQDDTMSTSGNQEYSNVTLLGVGVRRNSNAGSVVAELFDGSISFINIWDRVITPSEVTTLYNSGNAMCYDLIPSGLLVNLISSWELGNWTGHTGDEKTDMMGGNNLNDTGSTPFTGTGLDVDCS